MLPTLQLRGRIFREEGTWHCQIASISQITWANTLDDLLVDAGRLVPDYFWACRQAGTLQAELTRLGVAGSIPPVLHVDLMLDLPDVAHTEARQQIDIPLAA